MSEVPENASAIRPPSGGYRLGPRLAGTALEERQEEIRAEGASWRGWALGLLAVAGLSALIPYSDFVIKGTALSFNAFPMASVFLIFALVAAAQVAALAFGRRLKLSRQDLTLVFCMTMVMYSIPGVGFWSFWSTGMTGAGFHASPENRWEELIHPHLTEGFFPRDPEDPQDPGPRPVEWFYTGLPPGKTVPWGAWLGPYLRWLIVVALMYGIWFSVAGLLIRRWSDHERLPFPVAQVPQEMLSGYEGHDASAKPFLSDRVALWGIAITFLVHSWNALSDYVPNIPLIPLMNSNLNGKYLTEDPWRHIGVVHCHIFPSIIGLTFLLSLEVAFSLWFFYLAMKLTNLAFIPTYSWTEVAQSRVSQGSGALLMLVLLGLWLARSELGSSLKQALGREPREERPGELSPRMLWLTLLVSFAGAACWMRWFGIELVWALLLLGLFMLVMVGLARLIAEAGVFAAQFYDFPAYMLQYAATPAVLGSAQVVRTMIWDRVFTADWFRIVPIPNIMNALHLSGQMGLRKRTAFRGMALAVAVAFGLSFFTFLHTVYTKGGANDFGWFFNGHPQGEFDRIGKISNKIQAWEKKSKKAAEAGKPIPFEEIPKEAQVDAPKLTWMGVGGGVMAGFMVLRRFFFWWPHPAGYVMWMAWFPHDMLWFSFFLGWLCKFGISKYGGMKVYTIARRFFIGMVVGECCAAVLWVVVNMLTDHRFGYVIRIS
ncbi:MAG: hypothetical protein M5U26_09520 [Planctomycetota bacterium]|nr:hypothetical protein [Planctomycetota bacterium]